MRAAVVLALLAAAAAPVAERDPANPTCPKSLGFATYPEMRLSVTRRPTGGKVLVAEGTVDETVPLRLEALLKREGAIDEIWLRSPGGNAEAGNAAGRIIRKAGIPTRIPSGWACFSACNFLFMGGPIRAVEPGGQFVVHMFTFTGDQAVKQGVAKGGDKALGVVGEVEQGSALLATDDNDFLIRMGVSRKLLTEVMYAQKAVGGQGDKRCLTQDEVFRYNVANLRE
ncbi:MAG: hypothetical protein RQ833_08270 [Sphingomonadaceae bacterium]|nr:hypothetical protein [Sphingomonadaceae bacterium]